MKTFKSNTVFSTKKILQGFCALAFAFLIAFPAVSRAEDAPAGLGTDSSVEQYTVGPEDILEFTVLRPEVIQTLVTVAGDGTISLPYIGTVRAKGKTLGELQDEITETLGNGYMKYPVVTLALKESRSRKFFIYGEVVRPASYPMEENMTVFRALAVAGGFTKFGD